MSGRRNNERALGSRRGRWPLALGFVGLTLFGVMLGSMLSSGRSGQTATVTVTVATPTPAPPRAPRPTPRRAGAAEVGFGETASGAVAAASSFLDDLDGPALLSAARIGRVIDAVAAPSVRGRLLAAYRGAAVQVDEQLGLDTVPAPVVIVRAAPVGYRLEQFGSGRAVVSVWRVGIVGSGATISPEQSWRTETVSLVWLNGWRITALSTASGPTPPLAASAVSTPGELFASVPEFASFAHVRP